MGKRYEDERDDRQAKKELFEKNADEYLRKYGFKIDINPLEKLKSFDRFIVDLEGENIAGLEYKGKSDCPPHLYLDDKVFNNLTRYAYTQKISREKLFIGYYYGYDPEKEWTIFRGSDLIANGLGEPQYDMEYKAPGVIPYNLESRKHLAFSLEKLYEECYPSLVDDGQPISLVKFMEQAHAARTWLSKKTMGPDDLRAFFRDYCERWNFTMKDAREYRIWWAMFFTWKDGGWWTEGGS